MRGGWREPRPSSVDVVLPCLDEAAALPVVLARLPPGWRAIVVDNGSSDGTAEVARSLGATVVTEAVRGFGSACLAGLAVADADIVAFCDADGSLDLADLPQVVGPVLDGEADLVLGRRRPTSAGAWPAPARIANRVLCREVSVRTGVTLRDLGPMRAARLSGVRGLCLDDRRSGFSLQMVLRAVGAGWRVVEVDVPYAPRTGRSKVTGTLGGFLGAVRDMRAQLRAELGAGRA